jgi:hypothetical protein
VPPQFLFCTVDGIANGVAATVVLGSSVLHAGALLDTGWNIGQSAFRDFINRACAIIRARPGDELRLSARAEAFRSCAPGFRRTRSRIVERGSAIDASPEHLEVLHARGTGSSLTPAAAIAWPREYGGRAAG